MATKTRKAAASKEEVSSTERPVSPLAGILTSRYQEKKDLQNLNDRLAFYIDNVRQLQAENSKLNTRLSTVNETYDVEVNKVKTIYQKEVDDMRSLLDKISKEKARFELEAAKFGKEAIDLKNKLTKKEKELASLEKKYNHVEGEIKGKLTTLTAEKNRIEEALKEANNQCKNKQAKIESLQEQLENETLSRVDLENKLQSAQEAIQFKESLHTQQLSESRVIHERSLQEALDEEIRDEYEEKLADELQELRSAYEEQMNANRQDLEQKFGKQLADLQKRLESKSSDENKLRNDVRSIKSKIENLTSKNTELQGLNESLKSRIVDLEHLIDQERDWNKSALEAKDKEITKLREELNSHVKDYQDLLDVKIALDMEIQAYRKLLEGEENRLNLSSEEIVAGGSKTASPRIYSPRGYKRKRLARDEEETITDIHIDTDSKGDVEIHDFDQDGKFVKLSNKGEKDVAIGGWHLIGVVGDMTTDFKFHRSVIIKPGGTVTVWSSTEDIIHNPPNDIKMKDRSWTAGDQIKITLVNNEEEEVAIRTSKKVVRSSKSFRMTEGWLGTSCQESGQKPENCSIM